MDMTRGPWKANIPVDARKPITIETTWQHEGAIGGVIVATVNHHGTGRLQAMRNARAMAAAPEVFALLEKLLPTYVPTAAAAAARIVEQPAPSDINVDAAWAELAALVRRADGYGE